MPVDDRIHTKISRISDTFIHQFPKLCLTSATAIAIVFFGIHCQPDRIHAPVITKRLECFLIHIWRSDIPVDSMCADTAKLEFISLTVDQVCSLYRQSSMLCNRCCSCRFRRSISTKYTDCKQHNNCHDPCNQTFSLSHTLSSCFCIFPVFIVPYFSFSAKNPWIIFYRILSLFLPCFS